MYLGDPARWLPPPEPPPQPPPRRGDRVLGWLIGLNIVLVAVAPIGGATILQPLLAWLRG